MLRLSTYDKKSKRTSDKKVRIRANSLKVRGVIMAHIYYSIKFVTQIFIKE